MAPRGLSVCACSSGLRANHDRAGQDVNMGGWSGIDISGRERVRCCCRPLNGPPHASTGQGCTVQSSGCIHITHAELWMVMMTVDCRSVQSSLPIHMYI